MGTAGAAAASGATEPVWTGCLVTTTRRDDSAEGPAPRRLVVRAVRVRPELDLPLPAPATAGAAGLELRAAIARAHTLGPGDRTVVPTGFAFEIPPGYEAQVRPRSGLAARHGVTCLNSPGTIDSDYRGEVCVVLINLGREPFVVEPRMRIAQLVVAPVCSPHIELVSELGTTERGNGGFGHTGLD